MLNASRSVYFRVTQIGVSIGHISPEQKNMASALEQYVTTVQTLSSQGNTQIFPASILETIRYDDKHPLWK